jgi:iron complex transport system ATP-binding protein
MTDVAVRGASVSVKKTRLLQELDLDVRSGTWLSVIGPNGAGKSTLLRAIAGTIRASGDIRIGGESMSGCSTRERARKVAFVPQSPIIPPAMRVLDYVLLGRTAHLHPLASEQQHDRDLVSGILDDLDLGDLAARAVSTLSGGERQRSIIARALAQQADVLLLDEPTTALDLGHQQEVFHLLRTLNRDRGQTIISTMHDLTLAGQYADTLLLLAHGEVVAVGSAAEVLTEANIEAHYGARVHVTTHGDSVVVAPHPPDHHPADHNHGANHDS